MYDGNEQSRLSIIFTDDVCVAITFIVGLVGRRSGNDAGGGERRLTAVALDRQCLRADAGHSRQPRRVARCKLHGNLGSRVARADDEELTLF